MTENAPLRRTSLYDRHVKAGARMVPFTGFEMPVQYTGIVDEHQAVRTAAGLFDVSHMGELELRGEYAAQVVDYLITNDASKLVDGGALYTAACNEQGTILDDLIVYRAAQDRWLIVCNASNHDKMKAVFEKAAKDHCELDDRTDATALIALQGPKAFEVLALAGGDAAKLHELSSFHFRDAVVANVRCTVARTGYTGEDGFEIGLPEHGARELVTKLLNDDRVMWIGLAARDSLRLEAGLCLHGNDISPDINPASAGLMWAVPKEIRADGTFIGAEALRGIVATGPAQKRVGLKPEGRQPVRGGAALFDADGNPAGTVTSGGFGPSAGHPVAMGYVSTQCPFSQ